MSSTSRRIMSSAASVGNFYLSCNKNNTIVYLHLCIGFLFFFRIAKAFHARNLGPNQPIHCMCQNLTDDGWARWHFKLDTELGFLGSSCAQALHFMERRKGQKLTVENNKAFFFLQLSPTASVQGLLVCSSAPLFPEANEAHGEIKKPKQIKPKQLSLSF